MVHHQLPLRPYGARLRGEHHQRAAQPCCDALLLKPARAARPSGVVGFVICDGAGGSQAVALAAQRGARAAWRALLALRQLQRRHRLRIGSRRSLSQELMTRCFLAAFANASSSRAIWDAPPAGPPPDHTVLACLWDAQQLWIVRVGDCSLLLRRQGRWELPLPPQKGAFANQTVFLRPGLDPALVGLGCLPVAEIEALIAFSDGLEAAFLAPSPADPERLSLHGPLADLVLRQHRSRRGSRGYSAWLEGSLADPLLAQLSDDDRTLVIASR